MKFAKNLRSIRKEKNMTQKELAGTIGVVQGCIANWEAGKRDPQLGDIIRLAGILGVTVSRLAGTIKNGRYSVYANATQGVRNIPLYTSSISAGFPSPADDYIEGRLNLNDLVIKNAAATFFVKTSGDSMIGAGIHDGDILVVDRSKKPVNTSIVIAVLDGELTVKRLLKEKRKIYLAPENDEFKKIEITKEMEFIVWGVVTNVIHPL